MLKPVFLISLPRSGSTFLQKILMSHDSVFSTAEPWFLLPLIYMRKKAEGNSEYGYKQAANAFRRIEENCGQDFIDYQISEFALNIYNCYSIKNEKYFLDKTPRYYHCLDDIFRIFPDAKFIILLRNPVSIFASALKAFRKNTMRRLDQLDNDFIKGPGKIAEFASKYKDKVCLVTYESLISNTSKEIQDICKYLEIEFHDQMILQSFEKSIIGHGDKLGARQFNQVVDTTDDWKQIINSVARKKRLKQMLNSFSPEYISLAGIDIEELFLEVDKHHCSTLGLSEIHLLVVEAVVRVTKRILKRYARPLYLG